MKKAILATLLLGVMIATSASAASYKGKFGFTLLDADHPLGVAFGVGDKACFDVGLGFDKPKDVDLGWDLEAGIRGSMVETDNANVFVRGSASYGQSPSGYILTTRATSATDSTTTPKYKKFGVKVELGGEWWPNSTMSFYVRHGVAFSSTKLDVAGATSASRFSSTGEVLGSAGFVLWWGKK